MRGFRLLGMDFNFTVLKVWSIIIGFLAPLYLNLYIRLPLGMARGTAEAALLFLCADMVAGLIVAAINGTFEPSLIIKKMSAKLIQLLLLLVLGLGASMITGYPVLLIAGWGAIVASEFTSIHQHLFALQKYGVPLGIMDVYLTRLKDLFYGLQQFGDADTGEEQVNEKGIRR